ncbi:MAG TPA: glycosyltransferase [Streptosporangiaceae bacterium]
MRYLFATMDGGGNLYPELALAGRLAGRGHEVRFLGHRSQRAAIEQAGFRFTAFRSVPEIDSAVAEATPVRDWEDDPGTVFTGLCEHFWFGPASRYAADTAAEIDREPVDALAVDYFMYGALAAAEKSGRPTAALWHTTFGEFDALNLGLPTFNAARAGLGLPPLASVFEQFRRIGRVLVLTTESFDFAIAPLDLPANVRHVGPQLPGWDGASGERAPDGASPAGGDQRPLVLVALSTTYQAQEDLQARITAALGTLDVRGLVTTGPAVSPPRDVPANVEVRAWVPHAEVLPQASLVITHAGMGTVMAAMAYGVPMICLPMGRDQDGNAARVEHLGVGRVLPASSGAADIATAVRAALADPELARNARQQAAVIRADIAADRGVAELEALAKPVPVQK